MTEEKTKALAVIDPVHIPEVVDPLPDFTIQNHLIDAMRYALQNTEEWAKQYQCEFKEEEENGHINIAGKNPVAPLIVPVSIDRRRVRR